MNNSMASHIPVLLNEVIEGLNIKSDGIYVDCTLGRAGHSQVILSKLITGTLVGIDQDEVAIKESRINLEKINKNFKLIHSNFSNLDKVLKDLEIESVDGILMDLGVSSPQFDEGDRGFSYRYNAKLDMRMDKENNPLTAEIIVNDYSLQELTRIFQEYGEEKYSYSIAKNIIKYRSNHRIQTTFELVDIIKASKPMKELKKVGHPAKQVFQALRIEVNNEMNVLSIALEKAISLLKKEGGRLAVITFHSLEDRIVKNAFKKYTIVEGNRIDGPTLTKEVEYRLVNNKPIVASEQELINNSRSTSAKLRIIERK